VHGVFNKPASTFTCVYPYFLPFSIQSCTNHTR
jgi:hypothetical protein